MKVAFALVLTVYFAHIISTTNGCKVKYTQLEPPVSVRVSRKCDWFGWGRCSYIQYPSTVTKYKCCPGYSGSNCTATTVTGAPLEVVRRDDWNASTPGPTSSLRTNVTYVVIHHTVTPSCTSQSSCAARVRGMQNYHMNTKRWADIGYYFLVGEDGRVYEGRGWDTQGAHALDFNSNSVGIAMIGNYSSRAPNSLALAAAQRLIAQGVSKGKIKRAYTLVGHRQTQEVGYTSCPGNALMCVIMKWLRWSNYQRIGTFERPKC